MNTCSYKFGYGLGPIIARKPKLSRSRQRKPSVINECKREWQWSVTWFEVILTVHRRYYVEIKCQLDATDYTYCRFYCMLNMFRAILCPSSGAREYYTDGRCLWYLVLWFSVCRYGVQLEVMCPVCRLLLYCQFPHNNDDARSKSLQILTLYWYLNEDAWNKII